MAQKTTASAPDKFDSVAKYNALEMGLLFFIAIVALAALITAIGYDFSSSKPLFVILVPLVVLIGVQIYRANKAAKFRVSFQINRAAFRGEIRNFQVAVRFFCMLLALIACIYVVGHYAGLMLAMFYLIRWHGGESLKVSLLVPAITTLLIFLLFDQVFGIELFQGQIYRYFAGYQIW